MKVGKNWKSSTRYNLLTSSFFLFMLGILVTFYLGLTSNSSNVLAVTNILSDTIQPQSKSGLIFSVHSIVDRLYGYYDYYLAHFDRLIVLIWFVVLCFRLSQMLIDLFYLEKLKSSKLSISDSRIEQSLQAMVSRLNIKIKVSAFESPLVKSPLMIGLIKPMILFPIGLATMMPLHQIEAILAHELAHIKRMDFLINMVQSILEVIFFFNLPVTWISSLIRQEREQCCDDIALELTGNKKEYVSTLVQFLELKSPTLQVSFSTNKKSVLTRVKRIFGIPNPTFNLLEKFFLSLCFVAAIVFAGIVSDKSSYWNDKFIFSSFLGQTELAKESDRVDSMKIIEHLKKKEIIKDPENFSVKITNFGLYVNGVRQPKKIHDQFLKDYVKGYEHRLHYTITVKSTS
ncbi:M56 family metallopeptidase [Algoriphagus aestuarii]|nr:M56 family metallopeptidase [Algoriphagus aestuarii]